MALMEAHFGYFRNLATRQQKHEALDLPDMGDVIIEFPLFEHSWMNSHAAV